MRNINVVHQRILPSKALVKRKPTPTKIQYGFCILSKCPTFSVMVESHMLYEKKFSSQFDPLWYL